MAVIFSGKSLRFTNGFFLARSVFFVLAAFFILAGLFRLLSVPFSLAVPSLNSRELAHLEAQTLQPKSMETLASEFSTHSIFYVPQGDVVSSGPALDELVKSFHLIGIIQGDKPEALIKNQSSQQTYFARAGEKFDQFKVTEILAGSIKIEFQSQSKEMLLEEGMS